MKGLRGRRNDFGFWILDWQRRLAHAKVAKDGKGGFDLEMRNSEFRI